MTKEELTKSNVRRKTWIIFNNCKFLVAQNAAGEPCEIFKLYEDTTSHFSYPIPIQSGHTFNETFRKAFNQEEHLTWIIDSLDDLETQAKLNKIDMTTFFKDLIGSNYVYVDWDRIQDDHLTKALEKIIQILAESKLPR